MYSLSVIPFFQSTFYSDQPLLLNFFFKISLFYKSLVAPEVNFAWYLHCFPIPFPYFRLFASSSR